MSAVKGRRHRVSGPAAPTSLLQGRVDPRVHHKARQAADALGVSMAYYLERLVDQDQVDESGRPVWWKDDHRNDEVIDGLRMTG